MAILDLITEDCVKVPLTGTTKKVVLREMLEHLENAGKINDVETIYTALLLREDQGSTGLGAGIAVPHAKTEAVKDLVLGVGISPAGIDFDAVDGQPSKIFFLVLAPPEQSGKHLQVLSEIARISQSAAFLRVLISSQTAAEVVEMFRE
ncbi:PTS sugar transporter subunit IIA [Oceanispirochaeta crateris]|jgi:fructose-specific phosphotransferase system IIA component|uniref:PTS sugar transporter subunit IIA n=1 Tax=Oceanispirochaeta crateris TaxID=2518645 RepID=A0A5C1QGU9_9SPIO|nr:PTS sugar transporter subunit IIA [Oceanispirochaeta crateris]QEN06538.1 PTS sugar transporter subunit IIA [Oceanispirochaeta crateris]